MKTLQSSLLDHFQLISLDSCMENSQEENEINLSDSIHFSESIRDDVYFICLYNYYYPISLRINLNQFFFHYLMNIKSRFNNILNYLVNMKQKKKLENI